LAERTKVTKRTIDYYTNLGLLQAERSPSNYRYYDVSSVERIHLIEKKKAEGMALEEIKKEFSTSANVFEEIDVLELRVKMQGLEKEVSQALAQLEKSDPKKFDAVKKDSLALIQTLLLLLN